MTEKFMKVTNNQEKANAYKTQMARFKLARDQGFYYEAIFILYAMMEDRLSSFLLHAGVSNNKCNELTRNIEVRQSLESIINVAADKQIKLLKIGIKAEIIQKLLTWAASQSLKIPQILILLPWHGRLTRQQRKMRY